MISPILFFAGVVSCVSSFTISPISTTQQATLQDKKQLQLSMSKQNNDATSDRRDFLISIVYGGAVLTTSTIANADDDTSVYNRGEGGGDLTSQLFNEDGSLRDPNSVVVAQDKTTTIPFSLPTSINGLSINVATDGGQASPTTNGDAATTVTASYNLPLKWNQDPTSKLPLYYDSSEGKNGQSANRITVYSISSPNNLNMKTLEKASAVGVAKSLYMDQIPNNYYDGGVLKSDLISGRTVRKPIKSLEVEGGVDEQTYYEFDLAFAPLECPDFMAGNKENLGLGFCPYDKIFLISATVLKNNKNESDKSGTLMCCVVECNKNEWKMANSDIKRVRSSFTVDRA